ncbi:T9SS type A sorting domain-containing protein [Crocinitomix catalasitica]|uniref:T9SS type A sorting domain-containing protein n=1 Tax=Crocinitomix catalasitica TaxID=184607 RepID=UPI000684DD0E|nr:T9SS type A sorting domain-containing protein [Crocinitomix catalasitica]
MKFYFAFFFGIAVVNTSFSQKALMPDDNFEQAMIDMGYDVAPLDDSLIISEVAGITSLEIFALDIADLTGIKYFTALRNLNCSANPLTEIDLSHNVNLEVLNCDMTNLSSLDLSSNVNLEDLQCEFIGLTALDVDDCLALKYLSCGYNDIRSLNLTNNVLLEELFVVGNGLTELNLLANPNLTELTCTGNLITSLDLSENPNLVFLECAALSITSIDILANDLLETFICYGNDISRIDFSNAVNLIELSIEANELTELDVSNSVLLEKLYVGFNRLEELDLTANPALNTVDIRNNALKSLDLRNGENTLIGSFRSTDNPDLTCVSVDDVSWSEANWTDVDDALFFSSNCELSLPETRFDFNIYPNPTKGNVYIETTTAFDYDIYSMEGARLQNGTGNANEAIDISDLPSGIYLFSISNADFNRNMRLIKE